MDKWIGGNPKSKGMIDMWQERTILLTKLTQLVWVREKEQTVDRRENIVGF